MSNKTKKTKKKTTLRKAPCRKGGLLFPLREKKEIFFKIKHKEERHLFMFDFSQLACHSQEIRKGRST